VVFWILGFGLMQGTSIGGFIGTPDFFIQGDYSSTFPSAAFVIFQTVFCATAATIVSGAMAERTKFSSYCLYSLIISAVIYPISGHWIWGGGWLSQLGFHDFAGSTAVHMVGGVAALVGAKILGPRIGKYSKSGKSRAIPGHNLTVGALGCFILWFCWYGFNACSTVSMTGDESMIMASNVFVTTTLSAAMAANAVMIFTWIRYKKPDVSMTLNGALGGLVAITAGCDAVSPVGAAIIGTVAGIVMTLGIEFVDKVLKIDDPVGAIGVHGICGALGTILVGFFALDGGLFYGGGAKLLGVQALGVLAVIVWVAVTMFIVFNVIKKTVGLRVSKEEEIDGLDIHEHGLTSSYADFMPVPMSSGTSSAPAAPAKKVSMDEAVPVTYKSGAAGGKMTNVAVITKQNRFEALKEALDKLGVTGITVTQVLGYGMQKGNNAYYRGAPVDTILLPKIKIEIVICKIPVDVLVDTIKKALFTGNIGDGKIFVYDVENVIKVRTGEEGYDALQDDDEELLIS
jgi:Amt family ammonium transporter